MIPPAAIVQNCYVVCDLTAACGRLHELYGIGPFKGGGIVELVDHCYRGEPQPPIRIRGVFVQAGDLNIELIELVSAAPSAFHDMFADGGEGFHHVAMFCADYAGTRDHFVAMGLPVASEFSFGGNARICYIDARATLGHMIELYPEHAAVRALYREARDAAIDWDGRELIQPWNA